MKDIELQKTAITQRLQRGTSRGVMDPRWFFQNFTLRCYNPSPELASFVNHYWVIRWDPEKLSDPSYDYILTQPSATLSLSKYRPYVRGIMGGKYRFKLSGDGVEVGVKFVPGGLYAFWNHDMSKLAQKEVSVDTIFPEVTEAFLKRLYTASDDVAFVESMEELLAAHYPEADKNLLLIRSVVDAINAGKCTTVADVVKQFGVNERTLHYLFAKRVGVGVKWLIMRTRLLLAVRSAHASPKPDWSRIAADLDYSTQSHFVNDFKKHIGVSPSKYLNTIDTTGQMPSV